MKLWTTRMTLLAIGASMVISLTGCGGNNTHVDNGAPADRESSEHSPEPGSK